MDISEWEWARRTERHIKTKVIKEQSWWKTKYYWQGFVFPWSPVCPHWCPCLASSRLSYLTGFTKPKGDWLFCSNFLCKLRQPYWFCRFQEWWSYVYTTVNHYSPGILSLSQISMCAFPYIGLMVFYRFAHASNETRKGKKKDEIIRLKLGSVWQLIGSSVIFLTLNLLLCFLTRLAHVSWEILPHSSVANYSNSSKLHGVLSMDLNLEVLRYILNRTEIWALRGGSPRPWFCCLWKHLGSV